MLEELRLGSEVPGAAPRPAGPLAEAALTVRNQASLGPAAGLHDPPAAAKSMPGCVETGWEPLSGDCRVYESPQRSSSQRSGQLEKQFSKETIRRIHEGCLTEIKGKNRTGCEAPALDHPSQ